MVIELLLIPEPTYKIIRFCSEKWEITSRQATKYIKVAREKIAKNIQNQNDMKYRVSWHITKRNKLLKIAEQDHEIDKALNILDSLAKLEGLFDPALQEKLRAETDFYKHLVNFPIDTALKILNEK